MTSCLPCSATATVTFTQVNEPRLNLGGLLAAGNFGPDLALDLATGEIANRLVKTIYGLGDGTFSDQP